MMKCLTTKFFINFNTCTDHNNLRKRLIQLCILIQMKKIVGLVKKKISNYKFTHNVTKCKL